MTPYVFSTESKLIRFLAWFSMSAPQEMIHEILYETASRNQHGEVRDICTVSRFLLTYFLKWVLNWVLIAVSVVLIIFIILFTMTGILFAPWAMVQGVEEVAAALGPQMYKFVESSWIFLTLVTLICTAYLFVVELPVYIRKARAEARDRAWERAMERQGHIPKGPDYKRWAIYRNARDLYVDVKTCYKSMADKYCIPVKIETGEKN